MGEVRYDEKYVYVDGKRTKIVSGAMHYFRIVPEYWEDRLIKLKELGCNCVETYMCWNLHEKKEGEFDFSGWLDVGKFLSIAQKLGLYAIVRPGPYICSEWDFGGMPWWLLTYPDIELRCSNSCFLEKITPYLEKACDEIKPHLFSNGGNVIAMQIENEYGSYGNDKEYLRYLKSVYERKDMQCIYFTSDGETEFLLRNGTLPDVLASVNYRWDSVRCLASLQKYHGGQPGAVMELWNGRAQYFGEPIEHRDIKEVADSVKTAIDNAEIVNLYMFHGGTNFGFMNGTIDWGDSFVVNTTSYDVDAPLDEYGRKTPKYYAEQEVICKAMNIPVENKSKESVLHNFGELTLVGTSALKDNPALCKKTLSATVKTMEQCGQGYGYIIYKTEFFVGEGGGRIDFPQIHDVANVYIDGEYKKTLYRRGNENSLDVDEYGAHTLCVVVESLGRVNYGVRLKDYKGLVGDIEYFDKGYDVHSKFFGYEIYGVDLDKLPEKYQTQIKANQPAFYKYELDIDEPRDTVLFLIGFNRGVAFVNGFNLGRHLNADKENAKLYIPAPLLKKGKNEIVVFDVLSTDEEKHAVLTDKGRY